MVDLTEELKELQEAFAQLDNEHYFELAQRWRDSLPLNDARRNSVVVTRPNAPECRVFLDAWEASNSGE
jgi:hypothetical protein